MGSLLADELGNCENWGAFAVGREGQGDGFTHPAPVGARRIDDVLLSADWQASVRSLVLELAAFDHLPLVVELWFP